jgi:Spy/CpxP family protein refolding chaperone
MKQVLERRSNRKGQKTMKQNLITLLAVGGIALGGFAIAQPEDQGNSGGHGWHHRGNPLEHMTETLNLKPDQKAKVQPILDQAKPQIVAIHQDAMQKTKAVMDSAMSQIRPLLTAEQQKKADDLQKAHQDMHNAMKKMHEAARE